MNYKLIKSFILISLISIISLLACSKKLPSTNNKESTPSIAITTEEDEYTALKEELQNKNEEIDKLKAEIDDLKGNDFKGGMIYIEPEYKLRFVDQKLQTHILPNEKSNILREIMPNSVVHVCDLIQLGNEETWLYVSIPVYDSPMDKKGWVKEKDTVAFTEEKVKLVQSNVNIKKGSPYYEVDEINKKSDNNKKIASYNINGRLIEKKNGFACISVSGGLTIWVEEIYIVYPKVDS